MNQKELAEELARRAGTDSASAHALLAALLDVVREGGVSADILLIPQPPAALRAHPARLPIASATDALLVDELISRAGRHPFGLDFLRNGHLASVAAEFGAHAFTVEAARERLDDDGKMKN